MTTFDQKTDGRRSMQVSLWVCSIVTIFAAGCCIGPDNIPVETSETATVKTEVGEYTVEVVHASKYVGRKFETQDYALMTSYFVTAASDFYGISVDRIYPCFKKVRVILARNPVFAEDLHGRWDRDGYTSRFWCFGGCKTTMILNNSMIYRYEDNHEKQVHRMAALYMHELTHQFMYCYDGNYRSSHDSRLFVGDEFFGKFYNYDDDFYDTLQGWALLMTYQSRFWKVRGSRYWEINGTQDIDTESLTRN